jgi:2-C-methyl-D-erythritol 2,4-cyclodiphosphate synthase
VRVGQGFDAHRLTPDGSVRLGGVVVDTTRGVAATSDGDVAAHAVADALLGAAALGDIGDLFPSSDPRWEGADSMEMLDEVLRRIVGSGHRVCSIDLTVVAESVRVAPHRQAIRASLADRLGLAVADVSVKATTTDGLGWIGRDEGIAALAIAVIERRVGEP